MYSREEKVLIWLSIFDQISLKKQHKLLELYPSPLDLWSKWESDKNNILSVIDEETYDKMSFARDENFINNYIKNFDEQDIKFVSIISDKYSKMMRETISPPVMLYCKGNLDLLNSPCLAIVGTRRCTKYGKDVTLMFSREIAKAGITIVSGLCDGVDTHAHTGCVEVGGKTIAVLGGGLNCIYPAVNIPLAERILETGGLLVSEYKPNVKPTRYFFPARNRLVAGISRGVLITEATEKSGSMHTKEYALENNRDLYVVPGRITDIYSKGCNMVIKNCQSAMVLSPDEIIRAFGKESTKNAVVVEQLSMEEQMIMDKIGSDEVHYEQLVSSLNIEPKRLSTLLMRLELKNLLTKLPGNFYRK